MHRKSVCYQDASWRPKSLFSSIKGHISAQKRGSMLWFQEQAFYWRRIWNGPYGNVQLGLWDSFQGGMPKHPGCWYSGCEVDVHAKVRRLINFSMQLMSVITQGVICLVRICRILPTGTTSGGPCCCWSHHIMKADNRVNDQANLMWPESAIRYFNSILLLQKEVTISSFILEISV